MSGSSTVWVADVLGFWFEELGRARWFKKSDAIDAEINLRFGALYERLAGDSVKDGGPGGAPAGPQPRDILARIIVLDQFPRNMFRGTPRAFATDPQALALARLAVDKGIDRPLTKEQRLFVYLPFEHSENAADQETSVQLFSELGDAELTRFALRHQEIIARFGRFPHRNAILVRASTAEEIAFLSEPNSAF